MLTFFLDFVGLFMVTPIFAPLLLNANSSMVSAMMPHSERTLIIGLLVAAYGMGQFLGGPLLGELSDQFGREKVLLSGLLILVIGNFLGALGLAFNSLALLFICRLLTGIASGNGAVLFAAASDMSRTDKERGINLGYLTGAGALGAVIAPLVGSRLSDPHWVSWFNYGTPFLFMAFIFIINIVLVMLTYEDTHAYQRRKLNFLSGFQSIFECWQMPAIRVMMLVYFLFVIATESSFVSLPIFSVEKFQFNTQQIGNLMAVGAFFSAFSSLILNKKLSQWLTSNQIFLFCMIILTAGYALFYVVTRPQQLIIPWAICSFAMVLAWAHANAIIAGKAPANAQGKVLGVTQSLLSLSIVLGPITVGIIAAVHYNLALGLSLIASCLSMMLFLFLSMQRPT